MFPCVKDNKLTEFDKLSITLFILENIDTPSSENILLSSNAPFITINFDSMGGSNGSDISLIYFSLLVL